MSELKDVLVIVDMQNDFITGALANKDAEAIVDPIAEKLKEYLYAEEQKEIFFTMDTHDFNYLKSVEGKHLPVIHCVKGSTGWAIHSKFIDIINQFIKNELDEEFQNEIGIEFGIEDIVTFVEKKSFGYAEWKTNFATDDIGEPSAVSPKQIKTIEVVGTCTDICVVANVLGLKSAFPKAEIYVDSSCCAGTTKENHEAALQVMRCCHINVY